MNVLILTNPEHESFVYETTRQYANEHLLIVILDKEDANRFFNGFSYDIGISFMYTHKVPAEQVNSKPWFNFHPAPLPEYKGRDLCYHAIMNGEKEFGATIHYMDEGFDTGDIVEVLRFYMKPSDTAEEVSGFAIAASKKLFQDYLPKILETPVFPRIPNRGGTYYKKGQIIEEIPVRPNDPFGQFVRAVTYKDFHPRIDVGGVKYEIVREE
jgi:methionyl-tRNA formyltransferase